MKAAVSCSRRRCIAVLAAMGLWAPSWFLVPACSAANESDPPALVQPAPAPITTVRAVPRWRFSVLDLESSVRFNYMDQQGGGVLDRGIQYRLRLRSRFDLRSDGTTYLLTRAETGRGFNNSWNETAADLHPGQTVFNLKSIAVFQDLGTRAQLSAGGLDFEYGEGGDETYVSHDGYMTGYRAAFHQAAPWLPEKFAVTAAYVGDFNKSNVFSRFRMDRANYIQVLAQQNLAPKLGGSAELDAIEGAIYNRDALRYRHLGPFDDVMAEVVFRGTDRFTFAWSSELGKNWGTKWHGDLIYSDLPTRMYLVGGVQAIQNRGEIDLGKRLAGGVSRKLTNDCTVGVFAGRLLDQTPGSKRWVAQAGLSYQYSSLLNRMLR